MRVVLKHDNIKEEDSDTSVKNVRRQFIKKSQSVVIVAISFLLITNAIRKTQRYQRKGFMNVGEGFIKGCDLKATFTSYI